MPIRIEDFERGRVNLADYLMRILRSMPRLAFTTGELLEELRVALGGLTFDVQDFDGTLPLLEAGGRIERREIEGETFWALSATEREGGG